MNLGKGSCPLIHDERANRIREVVWHPPRPGSDLQLVRRATLSSGVPFVPMHKWVTTYRMMMMMMHIGRGLLFPGCCVLREFCTLALSIRCVARTL